MTHAEWLSCDHLELLLSCLQGRPQPWVTINGRRWGDGTYSSHVYAAQRAVLSGKASPRKLRLFASGCLRQVEHFFRDDLFWSADLYRSALDLSDRYADGLVSDSERVTAATTVAEARGSLARAVAELLKEPFDVRLVAYKAAEAALEAAGIDWDPKTDYWADPGVMDTQTRMQAGLLREVVGNPLEPTSLDPHWLTSPVVELARGAYEERAFDRLLILADALQDAGCDNANILDHCRGPGPHVRGCWVVDLVLGKE